MKYNILADSRRDNSGVILLITIWILVILTLFAIGIGYRVGLELRLSRYYVDSLKASYMAKAGIQKALFELENDDNKFDTLYACGIKLDEGETPQEIFQDIPIGDGYFSVGYQSISSTSGNMQEFVGIQDEQSKININALLWSGPQNTIDINILKNLFAQLDIDPDDASIIAASIIDWHDDNSNISEEPNGAEDEYYMGIEKPYHCKNLPFESLDELLLVRGMTQEIFDKIKGYITIYPIEATALQVNVNTASKTVLLALSRAKADETGQMAADSLVDAIIEYRAGDNGEEATEDDNPIESGGLPFALGTEEASLYANISQFLVTKSNYFRVNSQGVSNDGKIIANIETVLDRNQLPPITPIIYWREN